MSQYNQKLFSGGWRTRLHQMRFYWLAKKMQLVPDDGFSLFELGCFDCRSLRFIPKPKRYLGADAGWEGGINDAQMTFVHKPWVELIVAHTAHDLARYENEKFDYVIALETLEHIPDKLLVGYLEFLSKIVGKRAFFTVPVEVGPVFLAKYLMKRMFTSLENGETDSYHWREIYWAARGRVEHVERYEHKGFDYRALVKQLERYFTIVSVEGLPFASYPHLSFQVGIIAEPKSKMA